MEDKKLIAIMAVAAVAVALVVFVSSSPTRVEPPKAVEQVEPDERPRLDAVISQCAREWYNTDYFKANCKSLGQKLCEKYPMQCTRMDNVLRLAEMEKSGASERERNLLREQLGQRPR